MAGTSTDAHEPVKPAAAAAPAVTADTILFRAPPAAGKSDVQERAPESAPATDATAKLQSENPYINKPTGGNSAEVARTIATEQPTPTVRSQTVQTEGGPQSVKISQQGEKQTIYNNSGQQLYETNVNGKTVYSTTRPEAPAAAPKPESQSGSPQRNADAPPSASSIQARALDAGLNDGKATQVRSVAPEPVRGAQPESPVKGAQPESPVRGAQPESPVRGAQPESPVRGAQPESPVRGAQSDNPIKPVKTADTPRGGTDGDGPRPGSEPRSVVPGQNPGQSSETRTTPGDGKTTAPVYSAEVPRPAQPNSSPDKGQQQRSEVASPTPAVAAIAEQTLAANRGTTQQIQAYEKNRDNPAAPGATPGQPAKPDNFTPKPDAPAPKPDAPSTKLEMGSVTVGAIPHANDAPGPKPNAPGNPGTLGNPGDNKLPGVNPVPKPGDQPPPGQPLQPKPGDQPPLGQALQPKPGDLQPPLGQPLQRPGDGQLLPGQLAQQKLPDGLPKPGDVVPGKNPLHIDEDMAAKLKDLGQALKPGIPGPGGAELAVAKLVQAEALALGKDGKPISPLSAMMDAKGEIKVDLQALALAAGKPNSGIELNSVLKGLGVDATKAGDIKGVVNIDAKTVAALDPKAVEALIKAQGDLIARTNPLDAAKVLGPGMEVAGAKGDLRGVDLKGLDVAKPVDPLKTMEAAKAQTAQTAMELANQLGRTQPADRAVLPEGARGELGKGHPADNVEAKGAKPEIGVKPEVAGTKVVAGPEGGVAPNSEAGRIAAERATQSEIGAHQAEFEFETGSTEEERLEIEKRLNLISGKEEEDWELKDKKAKKETEESKLEEEQRNNAKNAMLAAMLAQKKEQEAERERLLLMEETKRKGEDKRRRYVVKDKDTLESIAKKQLRDVRLSALIYEINKHMLPVRMEKGRQVVDPRPGTSIWLPSEADIKQFRSRLYANPRSNAGPPTSAPAPGAGMTAEQELAAQFGANWDGRSKSPSSVAAGMMGAAVAKSQVRRANIEKILGPMGQKAGDTSRIRYIVRLGDSLDGVAAKHPALKDADLWPLLASINDLDEDVDDDDKPTAVLRRGMVLNLPTPHEIEQYRRALDEEDEAVEEDISDELASAMTGSVSQVLSATRSHSQLDAVPSSDVDATAGDGVGDAAPSSSKSGTPSLSNAELIARAAAHAAAVAAAEAEQDSSYASHDEMDGDQFEEMEEEEVPSPVVATPPALVVDPQQAPAPVLAPQAVSSAGALPSAAPPETTAAPSFTPVNQPGASPIPRTILNPTMPLAAQSAPAASVPQPISANSPTAPVVPAQPQPAFTPVQPATSHSGNTTTALPVQPAHHQLSTPQAPPVAANPPQPVFTPVDPQHAVTGPQSAPVTQPMPQAPGMEILLREPVISGDRLMWELYTGIRLVKSSVKWEPAIGVFRAQLEMLIGGVWYPVIFYEVFPTGAVRHEYTPGGKRKSVRIDLPPAAVQELADNDLVSKWTIYCRNYLSQIQGPKA